MSYFKHHIRHTVGVSVHLTWVIPVLSLTSLSRRKMVITHDNSAVEKFVIGINIYRPIFVFYSWHHILKPFKAIITDTDSKSQNWVARRTMTGPVISQEYLLKNRLLLHLGFDRSSWMVLIKREILITTGIAWPVSSDKRKARWELRCYVAQIRFIRCS